MATIKMTSVIGAGKTNLTINKTDKGNYTVTGTIYSAEGGTFSMLSEDEDGFPERIEMPLEKVLLGNGCTLLLTEEQAKGLLDAATKQYEKSNNKLIGIIFQVEDNEIDVATIGSELGAGKQVIKSPVIQGVEKGIIIRGKKEVAERQKNSRDGATEGRLRAESNYLNRLRNGLAAIASSTPIGELLNTDITSRK